MITTCDPIYLNCIRKSNLFVGISISFSLQCLQFIFEINIRQSLELKEEKKKHSTENWCYFANESIKSNQIK